MNNVRKYNYHFVVNYRADSLKRQILRQIRILRETF
jgi:hypothetical protein